MPTLKPTVLDDADSVAQLVEQMSAAQEQIKREFEPMLAASERLKQQLEPMLGSRSLRDFQRLVECFAGIAGSPDIKLRLGGLRFPAGEKQRRKLSAPKFVGRRRPLRRSRRSLDNFSTSCANRTWELRSVG